MTEQGNGGIRFTPREMFDRIETRLDLLTKGIEQSTLELKKEISIERHRINGLLGEKKLEEYTFKALKKDLDEMKEETRDELKTMKEENKTQFSRLEMKIAPVTQYLQEQTGVDKWKKRFLVVAGLAITAVGVVGGFIVAGGQ